MHHTNLKKIMCAYKKARSTPANIVIKLNIPHDNKRDRFTEKCTNLTFNEVTTVSK